MSPIIPVDKDGHRDLPRTCGDEPVLIVAPLRVAHLPRTCGDEPLRDVLEQLD